MHQYEDTSGTLYWHLTQLQPLLRDNAVQIVCRLQSRGHCILNKLHKWPAICCLPPYHPCVGKCPDAEVLVDAVSFLVSLALLLLCRFVSHAEQPSITFILLHVNNNAASYNPQPCYWKFRTVPKERCHKTMSWCATKPSISHSKLYCVFDWWYSSPFLSFPPKNYIMHLYCQPCVCLLWALQSTEQKEW